MNLGVQEFRHYFHRSRMGLMDKTNILSTRQLVNLLTLLTCQLGNKSQCFPRSVLYLARAALASSIAACAWSK